MNRTSSLLRVLFVALTSGLLLTAQSGRVTPYFNPNPVSPAITSIAVSPTAVTLAPGMTTTFSATLTGTGFFSKVVIWSATGGSITSAGVFTAPSAIGTYTITATSRADSGYFATATVLVFTPQPPSIRYTPSSFTATVGTAITALVPSNSGGAAASWSITPILPAGLVFNASTGQISGTPTAATSLINYTVTAQNSVGTWATEVSIRVNAINAAPSILYNPNLLNAAVNLVINPMIPTNLGGTATSWSISPALPAGLSFSTTTGQISGVPVIIKALTTYTVTATNAAGGAQTTLSLVVNALPTLGAFVWKRDIIYLGTKEVAEIDTTGANVTLVDHLDTPRYEVRSDGTVIQQKFMPFGESLTAPADAVKFAKGFTNHEQTDASGLIYMQARFYAPMYGRFLSPDPARDQHFEETQSWNIYSYVQNNPVVRIDPNGQQSVEVVAGAIVVGGMVWMSATESGRNFATRAISRFVDNQFDRVIKSTDARNEFIQNFDRIPDQQMADYGNINRELASAISHDASSNLEEFYSKAASSVIGAAGFKGALEASEKAVSVLENIQKGLNTDLKMLQKFSDRVLKSGLTSEEKQRVIEQVEKRTEKIIFKKSEVGEKLIRAKEIGEKIRKLADRS